MLVQLVTVYSRLESTKRLAEYCVAIDGTEIWWGFRDLLQSEVSSIRLRVDKNSLLKHNRRELFVEVKRGTQATDCSFLGDVSPVMR